MKTSCWRALTALCTLFFLIFVTPGTEAMADTSALSQRNEEETTMPPAAASGTLAGDAATVSGTCTEDAAAASGTYAEDAAAASGLYDEEEAAMSPHQAVGAYVVGDGVTADYDTATGAVLLYSENGTLWRDWIDRAGFSGMRSMAVSDTSGPVKLPADSSNMFSFCRQLTDLDLSGCDASQVTDMSEMFSDCGRLVRLNLGSFDTSRVTLMTGMFRGCQKLKTLDLGCMNTACVRDMSEMFNECVGLSQLDLGGFDTASVTNMAYMFAYCGSLTELALSHFDTAGVTNMSYMFLECSLLEQVDLSSFDTAKVRTMAGMFSACQSLHSLNLEHFDTTNVTTTAGMFSGCEALMSLSLESFDTTNVTTMAGMFSGCGALTTLDLRHLDLSKVSETACLFSGCGGLTEIYFGGNAPAFDGTSFEGVTATAYYPSNNPTWIDLVSKDEAGAVRWAALAGDPPSSWVALEDMRLDREEVTLSPGESTRLTVSFIPADASSQALSWTTSRPDIATVTDGRVEAISEGTALISCISQDNSVVKTCTVTVARGFISIDSVAIEGLEDKTYTGRPVYQDIVLKNENTVLVRGVDYDLHYENNIDAGTAVVTITGMGDYEGSVEGVFEILKARQSLRVSAGSVVKGGTCLLSVENSCGKVKYICSDKTIATVTSKGVVRGLKSGQATITVKAAGDGNHKAAEKKVTITVYPCPAPTLKALKNVSGGMKLTWERVSGAAKYRVYYKTGNEKWGKLADTSAAAYTWKKAKNGKHYTFTVRCLSKTGKKVSDYDKNGKSKTYVASPAISSVKNSGSKAVTVTWKEVKGVSGYELAYSKTSQFGADTRLTTVKKASTDKKTIKSLARGRTYYIRIRSYKTVSGKAVYSAWSAVRKVTVKQ